MIKADFHIHTKYSFDCDTPLEAIISRCRDTGINCIAIADHGTIEGALEMQGLAPFPVIIAEEVLTPYGEIMGMFLKEGIPSNISIEQAISAIRSQNALVCLPHPFDHLRGLKLDAQRIDELASQADLVEVFNARSILPHDSKKARTFAGKHDLPGTAGSDAHTAIEIGATCVDMLEFKDKDDFLEALRKGKICKHSASPLVHFNSTWTKIKRLF